MMNSTLSPCINKQLQPLRTYSKLTALLPFVLGRYSEPSFPPSKHLFQRSVPTRIRNGLVQLLKTSINRHQIQSTVILLSFFLTFTCFAQDSDGDGINDSQDNCVEISNPDQRDSNNDGYGNICDADLNNDGFVSFADLDLFKSSFGTNDENADFDGDGIVSFSDLKYFKLMYGLQPGPSASTKKWFKPALNSSWHIQLQKTPGNPQINIHYDVNIYDIDLFGNTKKLIRKLHRAGKKVICYFSAGSYEEWRIDAKQFKNKELGNPLDNWPGERWLDIRSANTRKIMQARLDLAKQKGCDGVDPDNVDGYINDTGFHITEKNQLKYNRFLANEAHRRGLAIGLKNDLDQIPQLVQWFDFSVNEQCHQFHECDMLEPFVLANKPVLNIEYESRFIRSQKIRKSLCNKAILRNLYTLILPLSLNDEFRLGCEN